MSDQIRRPAAIAACIALVVGIAWPFVATVLANRAELAAVDQRLREINARRIDPGSLSSQRSIVDSGSGSAGLLRVSTEGEASRRLEDYLQSVLRPRGIDMQPLRRIEPIDDERVRAIRASIGLRVPEERVLEAIASLETGSPTIFFEAVRLSRPDRRAVFQEHSQLDLTATIRVYLDQVGQSEVKP